MNREELLKNAKPILFSTEMVQAILDNRKIVTRRVIKFPEGTTGRLPESGATDYIYYPGGIKRPLYIVGDILYVRETWFKPFGVNKNIYKADNPNVTVVKNVADPIEEIKWKPSIHMPKEAARIFLKVTDVRVERLQDITETQVHKEGFRDYLAADDTFYPSGYYFRQTWDSTIKKQDLDKYGWEANPWVWVIEFERVEVENE